MKRKTEYVQEMIDSDESLNVYVMDDQAEWEALCDAIFELLGYCQEWPLRKHERIRVALFNYTSMEHEDGPILEIRSTSERGEKTKREIALRLLCCRRGLGL
jgi:hypothetical protein